MSKLTDTLQRMMARVENAAIAIRGGSSFAQDPKDTIGIATIKIVTEEQVQAVAFGRLDEAPSIIVRHNPLSRDVTDLLPLAKYVSEWADRVAAAGGEGRVWTPHSDAIDTIDVLGHRYGFNDKAPEVVQRMGQVCRILAHEARYPGQQVVADAKQLLSQHAITGLSPAEEGHLGALLVWHDASVAHKLRASRDAIRIPASGVLVNTPDFPDDESVERCRRLIKAGTNEERAAATVEMEEILERTVLREWQLMVAARDAYLRLALPTSGLSDLTKRSFWRLANGLNAGFYPTRAPERIALELEDMNAGSALEEVATLEADPIVRDRAAQEGRAFVGTVTAIDQVKPNFNPCTLYVTSSQPVIRLRLSDRVQFAGSNVTGIIRSIRSTGNNETCLEIELKNGVRTKSIVCLGAPVCVIKSAYANVRISIFNEVKSRQPWTFYGSTPPTLPTSPPSPETPLYIAKRSRRT